MTRVSVIIPTYKRLEFLKRAVADVMAQTVKDWELIISDDEIGDGETWKWLQGLSARDGRVRIIKNLGDRHGQVYNVNNALRACTGEWIKPLFDDDRLLPNCLEQMLMVANKVPQAVMIGCRAQKWRDGKYVGDEADFSLADMDVVRREDCRRAILMLDRWNGRTPTHMLIRRSAIEAGAYMPEDGRFKTPVDVVWFAEVLRFGDYAMTGRVLVHQREGEVASVTSAARADECALDGELFGCYHTIFDGTRQEDLKGLRWKDVEAEINGVRGVYHIVHGRYRIGLGMLFRMLLSFCGVRLTVRFLLQQAVHSRFASTKRLHFELAV